MKRSLKKTIKYYHPLVEIIARSNNEEIKLLLEIIDEDAIAYLCEVVYNSLTNFHSQMESTAREKLKASILPHKCKLRKITHAKTDNKKRRKLLVQSGGSLSLLLAAAIPLISSLLSK